MQPKIVISVCECCNHHIRADEFDCQYEYIKHQHDPFSSLALHPKFTKMHNRRVKRRVRYCVMNPNKEDRPPLVWKQIASGRKASNWCERVLEHLTLGEWDD